MKEETIIKLKALLESDPDDSFTRYALALEYAGKEDMVHARALLEDVVQRDPSYIPAYQQLGYLYQRLGLKDHAISIFKRGMELAKQQGDIHAHGEMQEALDEIQDSD